MMILSILATVVLLSALFYHRVSLFISSLILLAWTAALGVAGLWSAWVLVPLAIILVPFNFAPMRKSMISAPVFRGFRKVMPPMSRTEKEAIDAGTTWWEGDLFQGKPDWKKLHNYPQPRLTAEEQAFLDGPVEEACRMANDFQITHELADLPPELWAYLKEHRFFAMIIKKEYGGLEFSAYAQSRVLQKLSGVSGILAITVGVPNSLGRASCCNITALTSRKITICRVWRVVRRSLLCTDQPGSGFRCGRDSGYRDCLHGRMAGPAGDGDASDLEQTLHYAGTDCDRAWSGV